MTWLCSPCRNGLPATPWITSSCLFVVPGMFHCRGGVGDTVKPLLKWTESGSAPDQVAARRVGENKVVRTRPLCLYPQVAKYKGSGSIDDAANFSCAKP